MSPALPRAADRHLRALEIKNETAYDTRAIRSLVRRCLRALTLRVRGVVRVCYSASTSGHTHKINGFAALGTADRFDSGYRTRSGLNMVLTVPRDPAVFSRDEFARTLLHEALHWRGVEHADMTENQRYCRGPVPAWAEDVVVGFKKKPAPDPLAALEKRHAHAKTMLAKAERRAKLATTLAKKWRRRLGAAERALSRRAERTVPS